MAICDDISLSEEPTGAAEGCFKAKEKVICTISGTVFSVDVKIFRNCHIRNPRYQSKWEGCCNESKGFVQS